MTPMSEIKPSRPHHPWTMGRIRLPEPALGDLYARRGVPWGRLLAPHRHGRPYGWHEPARQRSEA